MPRIHKSKIETWRVEISDAFNNVSKTYRLAGRQTPKEIMGAAKKQLGFANFQGKLDIINDTDGTPKEIRFTSTSNGMVLTTRLLERRPIENTYPVNPR
jgi:hypothetical protein